MPRILRSQFTIATASVLLISAAPYASASPPSFTVLQAPGFSDNSFAYAISADGSFVAGRQDTDDGGRAFGWSAAGVAINLGIPVGTGGSNTAFDVSNSGQYYVGRGSMNFAVTEAFRWSATSGTQWLGVLPGYGASVAEAVTPDGMHVVGYSDAFAISQPFLFNDEGGLQALPNLAGFNSGQALAVADEGRTVVGYCYTQSIQRAFRWTAEHGVQSFLPTGADSMAEAISADGSTIVGRFNSRAFRWSEAGGLMLLPPDTFATSVSGDGGIIVGMYDFDPGANPFTPFIWDELGGMRPLANYLQDEVGLNLQGFHLKQVTDISADGRTIVGYGDLPTGVRHGFIAVVPMPSSLSLLMAVFLSKRRRRENR